METINHKTKAELSDPVEFFGEKFEGDKVLLKIWSLIELIDCHSGKG